MHHFFVKKENFTDGRVCISGEDYNHAVNVLRLNTGERVLISDHEGQDFICLVEEKEETDRESLLWLKIEKEAEENHELLAKVVLFQCLPKSDKLEFIIQKAVELGVSGIVPVASKNCVVKLDDKKAGSKLKRWRTIAESAAKQSMRSLVPAIHEPVSFKEAVELMEDYDVRLIPYENENGIDSICEAIVNFIPGRSIAVIIGPEGGFDRLEVSMAERHGIMPVSLGKRILRTETAAISILSLIMIRLEIAAGMDLEAE